MCLLHFILTLIFANEAMSQYGGVQTTFGFNQGLPAYISLESSRELITDSDKHTSLLSTEKITPVNVF